MADDALDWMRPGSTPGLGLHLFYPLLRDCEVNERAGDLTAQVEEMRGSLARATEKFISRWRPTC